MTNSRKEARGPVNRTAARYEVKIWDIAIRW